MKVFELHFTEKDLAAIRQLSTELHIDPYTDQHLFSALFSKEFKKFFPEEVVRSLQELGRTGADDLVIIKGLPVDAIIPDGELHERMAAKTRVSESTMLGISGVMGCTLSSDDREQGGKIIHNVSPVKGHESKVSSKSKKPFFMHTESAYLEQPPEFLMLLGLDPDPTAKTSYFLINDILHQIPKELIAIMKRPEFQIFSGDGLDEMTSVISPLIAYNEANQTYKIRMYQNNDSCMNDNRLIGLTDDAKRVLAHLKKLFADERFALDKVQGVSLQKGEAIIFSNGFGVGKINGILHGRCGHMSNPSRWLQRSFLTRDTAQESETRRKSHLRGLSYVMNQRRFSFATKSGVLRSAMLASDEAQAYKAKNPGATASQITLYGTGSAGIFQRKGSWLRAITGNTVHHQLISYLDCRRVVYRQVEHAAAGRSAEVANARESELRQGAKALVIAAKNKKDPFPKHYLVVICADQQLNTKKIKKILGLKDVSMVTPDVARELTGCEIGTIPPFSFHPNLEVLVDARLFENEEIVFNAGRLTRSIFMRAEDYRKSANATVHSLAKAPEATSGAECSVDSVGAPAMSAKQ